MEEIRKLMEEIIIKQLEDCKKNGTVPSEETLDTITTYTQLRNSF